jgi:hypothetical protein
MPFALTENSELVCENQGRVKLAASQFKLTVSGAKVLVDGDLTSAPVSGCQTVTDSNTGAVKCLMIASAVGGVASKLTVQGKGVLLDDIQGQTNGTVGGIPQKWSVQATKESKLQTV